MLQTAHVAQKSMARRAITIHHLPLLCRLQLIHTSTRPLPDYTSPSDQCVTLLYLSSSLEIRVEGYEIDAEPTSCCTSHLFLVLFMKKKKTAGFQWKTLENMFFAAKPRFSPIFFSYFWYIIFLLINDSSK